jgi:small-conductance mechanosensitive channel
MDCLRLLAMIAVIVIHVVALQWDKVQLHTGDWFVVCAYNGSVRWGVLVFLMISGALFLDPQKQLPLRTIYGKYILRLIIAYFAWGALYALFAFDGSLSGFAENLITGYYHMWYLPVLAGLYAMLPLLRKITEDPKLHGYILALALVGGFLIPNGTASNGVIVDYSTNEHRRVDFKFSVAYGTDVDKVKNMLLEIASAHPLVLKDVEGRAPVAMLSCQNESSLDITLRVWGKGSDYWTLNFDILQTAHNRMVAEGIEIPFNQLDVHVKNS